MRHAAKVRSFALDAQRRRDLGALPSPRAPGLPGSRIVLRKSGRPDLRWGGVGGGGGEIDALALPHALPPPQPSPSRLRACPLPANQKVTKPRQAGVWLGEGADRVRRLR